MAPLKPSCFIWQYESLGGGWVTFDDHHQFALNYSFSRYYKTVTLRSCRDLNAEFKVRFAELTCRHVVDGTKHELRCAVFASGGEEGLYVWQWKRHDGSFQCYQPEIALALEAAFQMKLAEMPYCYVDEFVVDLRAFKQTNEICDEVSDVERRRVYPPKRKVRQSLTKFREESLVVLAEISDSYAKAANKRFHNIFL